MAKGEERLVVCPQCRKQFPASLVHRVTCTLQSPNPSSTRVMSTCPLCLQRLTRAGVAMSRAVDANEIRQAQAWLQQQRQRRRAGRANMLGNLRQDGAAVNG